MREDKSQLMNYAMYGGVFLGLFWVFKYFFVIGSTQMPVLSAIGSFLAVGTPIILFNYLVKYKTLIVDNKMRYWHGVQFGIMLFFFASLLEAFIAFIHVTWIDPAFVGRIYTNALEMVKSMNLGSTLVDSIENQPLPTNFNYIVSNIILADVLVGIVLSMLIVPMAIRFTPKSPIVKS